MERTTRFRLSVDVRINLSGFAAGLLGRISRRAGRPGYHSRDGEPRVPGGAVDVSYEDCPLPLLQVSPFHEGLDEQVEGHPGDLRLLGHVLVDAPYDPGPPEQLFL